MTALEKRVSRALTNWRTLLVAVHNCDDEKFLAALLAKENKGKRRTQFLLRIHSRYNVMRLKRERMELLGK